MGNLINSVRNQEFAVLRANLINFTPFIESNRCRNHTACVITRLLQQVVISVTLLSVLHHRRQTVREENHSDILYKSKLS